jgi:hypothetical protein
MAQENEHMANFYLKNNEHNNKKLEQELLRLKSARLVFWYALLILG